jgi:hypothetical protein
MKKIVGLVVLLMAAPAFGAVNVTCSAGAAPNEAIIAYNTDEGNVRAFALELSVDAGAIAAVECLSADYYIYPGSIVIEGGNVVAWGSCVASGIDSNLVIVEMGSLYADADPDHKLPPDTSGNLLKVTVTETCQLCVAENSTRAGVVMEDPEQAPSLSLCCIDIVLDCYPSGLADYADWVMYKNTYGKAACECWCAPPEGTGYQCLGDGDQADSGFPFYYRVYTGDLSKLVNSWKKKMGDVGLDPCADFDHADTGFPFNYRVYTGDLSIMINNWKKTDAQLGPPPCGQ